MFAAGQRFADGHRSWEPAVDVSASRRPVISFGPFVLDVESKRLLRDGREVKLRRQALRALHVLASCAGQLVTHERLMRDAWGGSHVARHTIDVTLGEARTALGDCGSWISRPRNSGYRLLIPQSEHLIELGYHFTRQNTSEGLRLGLECFTDAAAQAPSDHRPWVGQCASHISLASLGLTDGRTAWHHFRAAHARAVTLIGGAPLEAEYAYARFVCHREVDTAEVKLCRALKEGFEQPMTCVRLMTVAVARGDLDAALVWATRARNAGPLLPMTSAAVVAAHVWRREFATAVARGSEAMRLHPHFFVARAFYGMALECSGRLNEALEQYRIAAVLSDNVPWTSALEAACRIRLGHRWPADAVVEQALHTPRDGFIDSVALAHIRLARGEISEALLALRSALEEMNGRWFWVPCDPLLADLRAHSAFQTVWDECAAEGRARCSVG